MTGAESDFEFWVLTFALLLHISQSGLVTPWISALVIAVFAQECHGTYCCCKRGSCYRTQDYFEIKSVRRSIVKTESGIPSEKFLSYLYLADFSPSKYAFIRK